MKIQIQGAKEHNLKDVDVTETIDLSGLEFTDMPGVAVRNFPTIPFLEARPVGAPEGIVSSALEEMTTENIIFTNSEEIQ